MTCFSGFSCVPSALELRPAAGCTCPESAALPARPAQCRRGRRAWTHQTDPAESADRSAGPSR